MMTHENKCSGVGVSTSWRGMDDSSLEEVYFFLFHGLKPNNWTLPSIVSIEYVEPRIINFLKKEHSAKLVCASDFIPTARPKPKTEEEVLEDIFDEQIRSFLFIVEETNSKYPILIRLSSERKKMEFTACCFDNEGLKKFVVSLAKKFGYKSDYENEIMFGVLCPEGSRMGIKEFPLNDKHIKGLDLALNYGTDFLAHHNMVTKKLTDNRTGLFIFHGPSGTGKTTYIKYLAHVFGGKRMFIFIPATNLETITSPSLLPVLLDHPDSILVLEDAEKAVVSRDSQTGNESLVSTLLNIGDGILGSMLNLSLIVTFNTRKDEIDKALLRKGRLLYEHEFKSLSIEDAKALVQRLGYSSEISGPMTLADIYNLTKDTGHVEEKQRRIGF
jgi:hypothetical protein